MADDAIRETPTPVRARLGNRERLPRWGVQEIFCRKAAIFSRPGMDAAAVKGQPNCKAACGGLSQFSCQRKWDCRLCRAWSAAIHRRFSRNGRIPPTMPNPEVQLHRESAKPSMLLMKASQGQVMRIAAKPAFAKAPLSMPSPPEERQNHLAANVSAAAGRVRRVGDNDRVGGIGR
jgi:hypothetical protein